MTRQGTIYPALSQGTLTPAYGRDYSNKADIVKDFRAGKDFRIHWPTGSTYCSISDGVIGEMVKLRFDKGRKAIFYAITAQDFVK